MLLEVYPEARKAPSVLMEDVVILVDAFFSVGLVIVEYHFAKAFDAGVKSLAFVGFGEFFYELLQVRVLCNHEGCDGNV